MRSECAPAAGSGTSQSNPITGHYSLGQFYIGSGGNVNEPTVASKCHTSLTLDVDRTNSKALNIDHNPSSLNELPRVASLQLDYSKILQESTDALNTIEADSVIKTRTELSQPLSYSTIGASDAPGQFSALVAPPTLRSNIVDRQVAIQPVSRVCELVEETWRDPAPNGGWGWLVVFGSFLCMFVVDGVCFSYGLYMQEMIVEGQFSGDQGDLHQSRPSLAALTLPGALLCGTYLLIGPFAGALVNRFDYRCVAMIGAILVTLSFAISALWIYDLRWFTAVFGVVGGIGFGLIYLPAITVVGHWFEQRRAFVVGVAMCGGGLGSSVIAVLVRPLARHVAWRGTLLLTAALFCQTLLGIALFRPLYVHELIKVAQRHKRQRRQARLQSKKHTKKTGKRNSVNVGSTKHSAERKAYYQRGSIMARIIEEKSRQRTTSTGSLDGMVITRENELAALSDPNAYEALIAAAAAYATSQYQSSGPEAVTSTSAIVPVSESISSAITTSTNTTSTTTISIPERSSVNISMSGGRGPGNLQTVREDVAFPPQHSSAAPVAVLPPPVQFTGTAARRIACAILRKLHSANLLPSYLLIGSTTANRHRFGQVNSPLLGRTGRTDSWTTFDPPPLSKRPKSEHASVYDAIVTDDRTIERKTSLATSTATKKWSLRHDTLPHYDLSTTEVAKTGIRERGTSRNVTSSKLSAQNEFSRSPSQLASMISLDSRTDQLITRELHLLPLDAPTKEAVRAALRAELSRPKYRADFFHSASRKPSSGDPDTELRAGLIEAGIQMRALPDSQVSTLKRVVAHPNHEVSSSGPSSTPIPTGTLNSYSSPARVLGSSHIPRDATIITGPTSALTGSAQRSTVLDDPGQRLRHWLSDPIELDNSVDETLAYLREMLDWRLLFSSTFLVLLVACSLNMLVLLVPFHFLPLLLEFGGMECRTNPLWCPEGLPVTSDQSWMASVLTWSVDGTSFVSPGAILFTIGVSSIIGRLLAAMYIEKGVGTGCRIFQRCPCLGDPLLLNNVLLALCAFSLACFPLAIHGVILTPSRSDYRDEDDRVDANGSHQIQAWTIHFRLVLFFVASIVYGLASAISLSLRSVILVELFGIRRLTNAFGYLLIFQGLAVILGPPLFGYFCDGECHGYLDYCGLPGSVPTRHRFIHNTACAKRLVYAFYICAALFLLTSLLFMPLRWLARHDPTVCARCCMRTKPSAMSTPTVFPASGPDMTHEIYPMRSMCADPDVQYDPQQTQTTQILPEVD